MISVHSPYAIVVDPVKIFVLAVETIGYPVGLRAVMHPWSHFSLNMLMNLRTITRILTVLRNEYVWGKTMRSARLVRAVIMATLPCLGPFSHGS
jgi:hypothetical protein